MTQYHHVVRVQEFGGEIKFSRHEDNYINPCYWEEYHWDRYNKIGEGMPKSVVCINVYKGEDE